MDISKIVIIQKYIRGYLQRRKILIPSSIYQTKQWRKLQKWYRNGKHNECETYQINIVEEIIKTSLLKTHDRIYIETYEVLENKYPFGNVNGFEWTENFDGKVVKNGNKFYFNLKFVCDAGGAQTRTLRETYNFIKYQYEYLRKNKTTNIYFVNILDGDECYRQMNKILYLTSKYTEYNKYIFIGDLYLFQTDNNICPMIRYTN